MTGDPRISIVLLTHNRPVELERTLRHLTALPERPRVIVVDNASAPGTVAPIAERFHGIDVVRSDRNLGAAGRNLGVAKVQTRYVAFCDDDTWWAPGSLSLACDLMDRHAGVGALSARVLVGDQQEEDPTCQRMANSPLKGQNLPGPALIAFMAGAVVMLVDAFVGAGGYEPRLFLGAEEALLALDMAARGWQMAYVPDMVIHHHPSPQRDNRARCITVARNRLWIAVMRLPWAAVWLHTRAALKESRAGGFLLPVLKETLRGLPWAIARRQVVPTKVSLMHHQVFCAGLTLPTPRSRLTLNRPA
ncbi:MAG: glycosyltransferase [Rubrivivax sp.]|nr:MAG: glycosyltransferase [Rubrivivax sp.]